MGPLFGGGIVDAARAAPANSMKREHRIWGPDVRQDVADEIAYHLAERQRELEASGLSPRESREAALRRFGNVQAIADACRQIDEQWYREQRRANMLMDLKQDAAYAVRSLLRAPAFTAVAIITLALGIGATTAIFSVIHSVLLRPLPYADASRLVFVWSTSSALAREPLTPGRLVDFREQLTSVSLMAGISQIPLNLTGQGEPERLRGSSVSSAFFDVLGVKPLHGDTFHANRADDRDVVLSYGLWVRRFASDQSIVGRTIMLNGSARKVVGVMPREFEWPAVTGTPGLFDGPELWIPGISRDIPRTPIDRPDLDLASNRRMGYLRAVARLKDGVTVQQAQREAEAVAARLAREYPKDDAGRGATVVPLRTQFFGSVQQPMLVLFGAAAFVLAIACANVANLLLGRGSSRRGEIAVRLALGASRGRIVRQFLTESVVLSLAGAVLGTVLASWAQSFLATLAPEGLARLHEQDLNWSILAFTFAVAVAAGVLFGSAPALQGARENAAADLKESGARGSGSRRTGGVRDLLAAAQLAIAVVLLVGATLLLRSFAALANVDTGIDTRNLLAFDLVLSGPRAEYQARQIAFYDEVLREITAIPGVRAAGAAVTLPIGGDDFGAPAVAEGEPPHPPGEEPRVGYQVVTPGYFAAMGIPFIEGRDFRSADTRTSQPVVVVNESFARQRWPATAVGRRVRIGAPDDDWMTIVGVVRDIRHLGPATPPRPEIYQPYTQRSFPFMAFVVRTDTDPLRTVPSIRAAVTRLDPAQPVSGVATMDQHIARALSRPRLISTLVGAFGALALVLAVVGTYGVTAYTVAQRSREIAIRSALGADRRVIMSAVLRRVLMVAGGGAVAGLLLAIATMRGLTGLLYQVNPLDAPTFAGVLVLLLATALAAGALPARRAANVSPLDALRF